MAWQITVLQQLINGLAVGSIYALIALGYTMVYGIIKLINFAHGEVYMLGAYFGFYAISVFELSLIPTLIVSMTLAILVGITLEKIAYKPLRNSPRIAALITAIGASLLLQGIAQISFGSDFRSFPSEVIPLKPIRIGAIFMTNRQIIIFATAIILMVILRSEERRVGKEC